MIWSGKGTPNPDLNLGKVRGHWTHDQDPIGNSGFSSKPEFTLRAVAAHRTPAPAAATASGPPSIDVAFEWFHLIARRGALV
jgi:hypothetical protein